MKRYRIEVKELGRNRVNISKTVEKINYDTLYRIVKPYLLSECIWFGEESEEGWRIVFAGIRPVGKITFNEIEGK